MTLLTRAPLAAHSEGRSVLSILAEVAPELMPRRYGNHEPLRKPFDDSSVDRVLADSWQWPFLWRGAASVTGSVWMSSSANIHGALSMSALPEDVPPETFVALLERLSLRFGGDFGFVHQLTPDDAKRGLATETVTPVNRDGSEWSLVVTSHDLVKWIPDLYWVTILGPSYSALVGRDRLSSAPALTARELTDSTWLLQLTEAPSEPRLDAVHEAVKSHLGREFFFDEASPDRRAVTPEFEFTGNRE